MGGWRGTLSLGLLLASASCDRSDDCRLYHSCSDSLIDWAVNKLDDGNKETCRACLEENCPREANQCSADWECNLSARCRMSTSPSEYQRCIHELYEHGYTQGTEAKKPWEGLEANPFIQCRRTNCLVSCFRDPYDCQAHAERYRGVDLRLAVQKFGIIGTGEPAYGAARNIKARACFDGECAKTWSKVGESGHIELELNSDKSADTLYFEIAPGDDVDARDFPNTLYYPRILGDETGVLRASAYVVRNGDITNGNSLLGFGDRVLEDVAQSVILPDGCTWEPISVPNVRISVKNTESGAEIPQCHQAEPGCFPNCSQACIWYARSTLPYRIYQETDGSGAGAVALPEGRYDVKVLNADGEVVAERAHVRMRKGWMTIVRTWPALGPRRKDASNAVVTPRSGSPAPTDQPPERSRAPAP